MPLTSGPFPQHCRCLLMLHSDCCKTLPWAGSGRKATSVPPASKSSSPIAMEMEHCSAPTASFHPVRQGRDAWSPQHRAWGTNLRPALAPGSALPPTHTAVDGCSWDGEPRMLAKPTCLQCSMPGVSRSKSEILSGTRLEQPLPPRFFLLMLQPGSSWERGSTGDSARGDLLLPCRTASILCWLQGARHRITPDPPVRG